jgi:hypothetical protein
MSNLTFTCTSPKLPFPSGLLAEVYIKLQRLSCVPHANIPHLMTFFQLMPFYCLFIRISGTDIEWATAAHTSSFDVRIHIFWSGVTWQWDHKTYIQLPS